MRQLTQLYVVLILTVTIIIGSCKPKFYHQITTPEIESYIAFLASDSLKGRFPGTPEDSIVVHYIAHQMDLAGLHLLSEDGLQTVEIERGYQISENNSIKVQNDNILSFSQNQLAVAGFSANGTFSGKAIITGKTDFELAESNSDFIIIMPYPKDLPSHNYNTYRQLRSIGLSASDNGAKGLIFVGKNMPEIPESDQRLPLRIPVFNTTVDLLGNVLPLPGNIELADKLKNNAASPFPTDINIEITSEVMPRYIETFNTMGELKGGEKTLADEYIIIGAHHDHLGMGGRGSSSRVQDTVAVHYGADDNASGVAGVIELSQHLMSRSPSRSFIFTTFAAEEMGLFGSKEFTENPPINLDQVQVMINLDMIGRLNDSRQLQIGGVGTSPVLRKILDSVNLNYEFKIAYSEAGYGPSDHSSFYAKDVPVVFISTGAHADYHTPADSKEKINYPGMQEVISYVSDVAYTLSELPEKITFTLAGPKESSGSRGREGMVTFGLMPDVMYDGNEGMPVSFVTEGKPAAIAGMKGGDIITEVDGKQVGNVYDYMERLSELEEGQSVIVTVNRDGDVLKLLLKL